MRLKSCYKRSNFLSGIFCAASIFSAPIVFADEWIYTVKPGDNLWNITERHLNSMQYVPALQKLNRISNPYVIPPGKELNIPIAWTKILHAVSAHVVNVQGVAELLRHGDETKPIQAGMQLRMGDAIKTENDAFVTIEFADQSRLRIQDNTLLQLENMQIYGDHGLVDTLIDVQKGRTENSVPKSSEKATRFRIKTPSAISSVRGTQFRVGLNDETAVTSSEVLTGNVDVSGKKRNVTVPAGFGTATRQGGAPRPPIRLLPPPDLSESDRYYQSLPLRIKVPLLEGAHAYRAQIARDQAFEDLWSEFTTASLPFRDGNMPDGVYWLRVRGIDRTSIEGHDAIIPFGLNARPEIPFVIAPLPGGVSTPENQEFKWTANPEADHYALLVGKDSDFSQPIYFNPEVRDTHLTLTDSLTPGHYYWRIFSVSASEGAGPFSDAMTFRVPYPGPSLEDTQLQEDSMTFAWRAAAENQRFQVQFARDSAFNDIIHDEPMSTPQLTIAKPDSGTYYLRIKTIEADGFQGPWGPAQEIDVPRGISYWFMLLMLLPLLVLI